MAERTNLFTFTIAKYTESDYVFFRRLGINRYAINIGKISFILEFWFLGIK